MKLPSFFKSRASVPPEPASPEQLDELQEAATILAHGCSGVTAFGERRVHPMEVRQLARDYLALRQLFERQSHRG